MRIAVFDLETNGAPGASVLSASSIVFDEAGRIFDVFNRFYLPIEPFVPYLFNIHGLTPERLLALRDYFPSASPYFIEDWPELMEFWERWEVEGIVIHNARFDMAFLPEIAQWGLRCWCSMRGLTAFCALPRQRGKGYKFPKLREAVEVVCSALPPSEATERAEEALSTCQAHVSLSDCFELYRVAARILRHRPNLVRFAPLNLGFSPPSGNPLPLSIGARPDDFTEGLVALDRRLRSQLQK